MHETHTGTLYYYMRYIHNVSAYIHYIDAAYQIRRE